MSASTDSVDLNDLVAGWHPGQVEQIEQLTTAPFGDMADLLSQPAGPFQIHEPIPPLWHWLYFDSWVPTQRLGEDGHPIDGHFLPPIPSRRRMIAGGRLTFLNPLVEGELTHKVSGLSGVKARTGQSGPMLFVTVRSEISQAGKVCVTEERDVVYRSGDMQTVSARTGIDTVGVPQTHGTWQVDHLTNPVMLFRFSVLTRNSHRIHYDQAYCRDVEQYPDLVVHGPLLILMIADLIRRSTDRPVASLNYRLRAPVFVGEKIRIVGAPLSGDPDTAALNVTTARSGSSVTAEVTFS